MTTTTVEIDALYPTGAPCAGREVSIRIVDGGAGASTGEDVRGDQWTVRLDANGHAEVDLRPNAELTPAGTFYRMSLVGSVSNLVRDIEVPVTDETISWADASVQVSSPVPQRDVSSTYVTVPAGTLPGVEADYPPVTQSLTNVLASIDDAIAAGGGTIGAVPTSRTLAGLDLSADRTASALRTALGLVIGTDVLAPNGSGASLTSIPESAVTNLVTDLAAKAPLASPTFTGTPAAPTAAAGTATTQVATTAFVGAAAPARPRVVGAYANGALSTRTGTYHDATALGRFLVFPTWLWAGSIDRIYVRTGVAAVSTWRIGIYPLDATTLKPDGQTKLSGTDSSINMNATAGTLEATITATIPSSGLWGMAVLVDAYTATPSVHSVSSDSSANLGWARPWSVTGQSVSGLPHFDGIAFMATGVTTGVSALPTTCPTTAPNPQTPVVGVRYA